MKKRQSRKKAGWILFLSLSLATVLCGVLLWQRKESDTTQSADASPAAERTVSAADEKQEVFVSEEKTEPFAAINSDHIANLSIPDTLIDFPVMFTPNEPRKYLYRNADGADDEHGTPFIDERCNPDTSDNLIIYAHNMSDGTMFAPLLRYQSEDYAHAHPTIQFVRKNADGNAVSETYAVFAAFADRVYYEDEDVFKFYNFIDAEDEETFEDAVRYFKDHTPYDTGVAPRYGDKLLMLVTCAYHEENGRFVVVAVRD